MVPCCVVNMDEADTSKASSRYSIVVPRDCTTSLQMVYANVPLAFRNLIRASSLVLDMSTSNILSRSFSGPSWLQRATSLASSRVLIVSFSFCYGSTWAGSQRGFNGGSHTVVPDRSKNAPSYVSTYNVSGDWVQTHGTCERSTDKGATGIVDLW